MNKKSPPQKTFFWREPSAKIKAAYKKQGNKCNTCKNKVSQSSIKTNKGLWNFTKPLLTHKLTIVTYDIFGARIIKDEYKLAKNLTCTT